MVKVTDYTIPMTDDGNINFEPWLATIAESLEHCNLNTLRNACILAQLSGEEEPNYFGESCFMQGLIMAQILADLHLDQRSLAAAIVYPAAQYADLALEDISQHLGEEVANHVAGICQMDAVNTLERHGPSHKLDRSQIDNIRRMLLAMVEDVTVVLVKLAEQVYLLRAANILGEERRQQLAREAQAIYAPLANRLGVGTIKWELEDLAFRYLQTETYKSIAKKIDQRRIDRDRYVADVVKTLEQSIVNEGISDFEVQGRAKHIYSIYRKMQRKNVSFEKIYDVTAVRVLVPEIEDCYAVLSSVHARWPHIPEEFDDYISSPKPNGYRSIHTAVVGPDNRNVEVQIRTFTMHEESELGVAAHWVYKEGGKIRGGYEEKISWLRQVLDWQRELAISEETAPIDPSQGKIFDDRVYVFTPAGHIIDLPAYSTPIDFAYRIHSEVGHRCRGAKINGKIVPLTHQLNTGEQVEIIKSKISSPSRDWLNPNLGYLKTSHAKAKVHHFFKQQDHGKNLMLGEEILNKELKRLSIKKIDLDKVAPDINMHSGEEMLVALGCGNIRLSQILNAIQKQLLPNERTQLPPIQAKPDILQQEKIQHVKRQKDGDISICGVGKLLTQMAKCCHPVPGDDIVGYITVGRGVTIHRQDCINVLQAQKENYERLIEVDWGHEIVNQYPVNIILNAYDRNNLVRDILGVLSSEKVNLTGIKTKTDPSDYTVNAEFTIEISSLSLLSRILERLCQLPNVINAKRVDH